jgi:hypothetical protein
VSLVIPAHNESNVIVRCLRAVTEGSEPGEVQVVVVCNGCSDDTAERARSFGPGVEVVEIAVASKIAALNAGDAVASRFPRFYVDADVELTVEAIRATADALDDPGVDAAAPRVAFELTARPWAVRGFYGIWAQMPYLNDEMIGSGVYALSERGRSRFGAFPELTADDQFVMQLFPPGARRSVAGQTFTVHPPTSLRSLVNVRTRAYRGQRELTASGRPEQPATGGAAGGLARLLRRPSLWPAIAVYTAVNASAKLRARRSSGGAWERDDTARLGGG